MQDQNINRFSNDNSNRRQSGDLSNSFNESNNSFKRTREQYETQQGSCISKPYDINANYSRIKNSNMDHLDDSKDLKETIRTSSYNQSNLRTIYNAGQYQDTPSSAFVVNQTFHVPNDPHPFRPTTQSKVLSNNQQQSTLRRTNQLNKDIISNIQAGNRPIQGEMFLDQKIDNNVSEFEVNENQNKCSYYLAQFKNLCGSISVTPKNKKNLFKVFMAIAGGVLVGSCVYYLASKDYSNIFIDNIDFSNITVENIKNNTKNVVLRKEALIILGVFVAGVIVYVYLKKKKDIEDQNKFMANEDYLELKQYLLSSSENDNTFIGAFVDYFINRRVYYWNISKERYSRYILPLLQCKIREDNIIEECEVLVSQQSLLLWRFFSAIQ